MINSVCRVCLAYDIRLYSITNTHLQEVFEKIMNIAMLPAPNSKLRLCYICVAYLSKCEVFIRKCIRSHEVLKQLLNSVELSHSFLSALDRKQLDLTYTLDIGPIAYDQLTPIENVFDQTRDLDKNDIKLEIYDNQDDLKVENVDDDYSYSPNNQDLENGKDIKSASDSEDDIPLKEIAEKTNILFNKKNHKSRKKKEKVQITAQVIILSKEEQRAEVMERSKSINYLESPYKCDFCFKGFINLKAYRLHMGKHDKNSGNYSCDICQLRYKTERQLRAHIITSHSHIYKCGLCEYRAHTAHQAKEHDNWHKGFTFECKLCSKQFKKSSSYLTHMRTGHPSQYTCDICGAKVISKHGLAMHMSKVHCDIDKTKLETIDTTENATCNLCGLTISVFLLKSHLETHEDPSLLSICCSKCGKTFKTRKKLRLHNVRVHLGIKYNKNVVCEVCGNKFPSNAALTYHQRTHTGEKPYSCTVCSKRFANKNRLRTHFRVHSGEKPYSCSQCNAKFAQKPALNRHFRIHTGAKPYICHLCSKSFTQSNSLKLHVRTVHLKMPSNYKKSKAQNCEINIEKIENTGDQQNL